MDNVSLTDPKIEDAMDQASERYQAQGDQHHAAYVQATDSGGAKVLVKVDSAGSVFAQHVTDFAESQATAKAGDDLQARMAATPAAQRKTLTEDVDISDDDKWRVTLTADGKLGQQQTKKPDSGGFFSSFLGKGIGGVLDDIGGVVGEVVDAVAPVIGAVSNFVPVLKPVSAGLGMVQGVESLANGGDPIQALQKVVGGAAGAFGGSPVLSGIGDALTAAKAGQGVANDLSQGDFLGAIGDGASAAGKIGGKDVAKAVAPLIQGTSAAKSVIANASSGNVAGVVSTGLSAANSMTGGSTLLGSLSAAAKALPQTIRRGSG